MTEPSEKRIRSLLDASASLKSTIDAIAGFRQMERLMRQVHPDKKLMGLGSAFLSRLCVIMARRMINTEKEDDIPLLGWIPGKLQEHAASERDKNTSFLVFHVIRADDHEYYFGPPKENVALVGGAKTAVVLEYLCAEILEACGQECSFVWAEDIYNFLVSGKDEELSALFSRKELDWSLAVCGIPLSDDNIWFEDEAKRHSFINMCMRSPVVLSDPGWDVVHAELDGYCGQTNSYPDIGPPNAYQVTCQDAQGKKTKLVVVWSDGNADANTGIFGRVYSNQGVHGFFYGHRAGDCGTLVEATSLGRTFAPFKELDPLPSDILWSENSWTRQVEALMYAWAMLSRKDHAENMLPKPFRKRLIRSIMRVIGRQVDRRVPLDIWDMIADRADVALPQFYRSNLLEQWSNGVRDVKILNAFRFAHYGNSYYRKPGDDPRFDKEWSKSSYAELASYESQYEDFVECSKTTKFESELELLDEEDIDMNFDGDDDDYY